MHRRIPWTELFSCTITSEASSLTLSEVENIFAAWRLVLKKMYLSRRIICFSGIDPLTPWNGLAGSFQCQWPFPKLRWFLKFQSYKILYDTARLWNIMEKCWAWSCYLSAGDVMYILLFLWAGLPSYYWPGRGEHEALGATNLLWTGCVEELCQWQPTVCVF